MTPAMPTFRVLTALSALSLLLASPAAAALTKAQQACVVGMNASWQKTAAVFDKATSTCTKRVAQGQDVNVPDCVFSSAAIAAKVGNGLLTYFKKCDDVDGDGVPKLPAVFVGTPFDFAVASQIEWTRAITALYGVDFETGTITEATNTPAAHCQAAVQKVLGKCAGVRRKVFNACKKSALAVGKDSFPLGATTPAELETCTSFDPKGAIAKACAAPADKVSQTLAKQCVAKGVDLTVAFPHCAAGDVPTVQSCLQAPTSCAVCLAIHGVDVLGVDDINADCDLYDDAVANRSCTPVEILVPAYANPCCGDGPAMWSGLTTAASLGRPHINVILNPASGPGTGPEIDPNYVNTGPVGPLLDVRATGASIYGYVSTSFATRPIADAKADIDLYYTASYWRGAGVQVDGIFLDEMSSDLPNVGYYQQLRDYVHAKDAGALVIANPGQPATQDTSSGASGFTVMDYATAADVLVTYEGTDEGYLGSYANPVWADALPASHFAHLFHGVADETAMETVISLMQFRKVGMVYFTDDVLAPNPWDTLPTYFPTELDIFTMP